MAEIKLDTKASVPVCTLEERKRVTDAYNSYLYNIHGISVRNNYWGYNHEYHILAEGIGAVTGQRVVGDKWVTAALPGSFVGDGSVQVDFPSPYGDKIIQTEYLPLVYFGRSRGMPYYDILMKHSRPFKETHEGIYYPDRVRLEAYLLHCFCWGNNVRNRSAYLDYRDAESELNYRRELILPIVTANK